MRGSGQIVAPSTLDAELVGRTVFVIALHEELSQRFRTDPVAAGRTDRDVTARIAIVSIRRKPVVPFES